VAWDVWLGKPRLEELNVRLPQRFLCSMRGAEMRKVSDYTSHRDLVKLMRQYDHEADHS
jgi:hypothetical protein